MNSAIDAGADDPWADINFDEADMQRLMNESSSSTATAATNLQKPQNETEFSSESIACAGFDDKVGDSWIYPSNLPCRSYQLSIAQASLYRNTLVVLPTGLGKTFIAAVVMYNIYRWYPTSKIIFMAPTRPLVAQQIEACARVMPFIADDTIELTGKLQRTKRAEYWRTKRVFFATPQVVQSDIYAALGLNAKNNSDSNIIDNNSTTNYCMDFPFDQLRLIVVDEAHKAKGRYAYTEVVQNIWQKNQNFRVLALSATPGRGLDDVTEIIRNLLISHLEVRCDTSIDVMPYIHQRSLKTIVVPLGEEIDAVTKELLEIIDPYIRQLINADVLSGSLRNINRNFLVYEHKRFRERSLYKQHPEHTAVNSNFSICISLYHGLELLERHGLRVFLNNFEEDEEGRTKFVLKIDRRLRNLIERLRENLGPNPFDVSAQIMTNGQLPQMPKDLDFGHPKFEYARDVLVKHFQEHADDTRAIVFCEYRESVMLMYRLLLQQTPLLRPRCFVGQGGTTGSLRALTQKQQIQIMSDFRSGKSNILIATSVGEEGIDVGEVELIVCFDISTSNPQRFIQRIGRTGRKKKGNVVMLVTEGREQQLLKEVLANKDQTNKKLLRSSVIQNALFRNAPRLVPNKFKPKIVQTHIEIDQKKHKDEVDKNDKKKTNKIKKTKINENNNKNNNASQDLRKFFNNKKTNNFLNLNIEDLENINITQVDTLDNTTKATTTAAAAAATTTKTKMLPSPDTEKATIKKIDQYFDQFGLSDRNNDEKMYDNVSKEIAQKRLRKLNKFLKSITPAITTTQQIQLFDYTQQLISKQITNEAKLLYMKMQPDFVRTTCEKMNILNALAVDNNSMSIDEQKIREIYVAISAVICQQYNDDDQKDMNVASDENKNKMKIERFLEDAEYQLMNLNIEKTNKMLKKSDYDDGNDFDFETANAKIFKDFEIYVGSNADNFDYIQQELKKTKCYQNIFNENDTTIITTNTTNPTAESSMIYETILEQNSLDDEDQELNDFTLIESKYCSQWEEFELRAAPNNKSTPLQKCAKNQLNMTKMPTNSLNKQVIYEVENDADFVSKNINDENDVKISANDLEKITTNNLCVTPNTTKIQKIQQKQQQQQQQQQQITPLSIVKKMKHLNTINNDINAAGSSISTPKTEHKTFTSSNWITASQLIVKQNNTPQEKKQLAEMLFGDLDIDMDAFLEPFSEEFPEIESKIIAGCELLPNSQKENENFNQLLDLSNSMQCKSPNLFDDTASPIVNNKLKFNDATNTKELIAQKYIENSLPKPKINESRNKSKIINSPNIKKLEKSPSIFDLYMNTMRGRSQLSGIPITTTTTTAAAAVAAKTNLTNDSTKNFNKSHKNSIADNDSPIILNRKTTKRRIFESDTEEEVVEKKLHKNNNNNECDNNDKDTDCEEIAATQKPKEKSVKRIALNQRKKRRRLCAFIDSEAAHSGNSDVSADEPDQTIDNFLLDSVIVSDSDESDNGCAAPPTQMQAIYLRSLKSPQHQPNAFKLPAFRVYNDQSHIFSQNVVPAENSQYINDSFVVDENFENDITKKDESLCPLERAERILKEHRREKRKLTKINVASNRKRRKQLEVISDSSDDN